MTSLIPRSPPFAPPPDDRWAFTPPPGNSSDDGSPIDVMRVLQALRRRWWLVVGVTLLAGAVAWHSTRSRTVAYRAGALVQLVDARQALTSGLVKSDNDSYIGRSLLSEVEIIRSRGVAAEVVDSQPVGTRVNAVGFPNALLTGVQLADSETTARLPLRFTRTGVSASGSAEVPYGAPVTVAGVTFAVAAMPRDDVTVGALEVVSRDRATVAVMRGLDAEPRKNTLLIDLTYTGADSTTVQQVVNRVAQVYQAVDARTAQQQSRRRRTFIEDQLRQYDAQLAAAERALSTFRGRQQSYSSANKFSVQASAMSGIVQRRDELDAERRGSQALLRDLTSADTSTRQNALRMLASSPGVSQNPTVVALNMRLADYGQSRAELTSGSSGRAETAPDVQRLDSLMAKVERQLAQAVRSHIALLDAQIASLDAAQAKGAAALQQLPAAEAEESRLSQNAEALRQQAAVLRTEYQQARIAEAVQVGQVEVVDYATATQTLATSGGRTIAFALLLGLMAGSGGVVLWDALDRTIKQRDEIERLLRLPVLGTIPQMVAEPLPNAAGGFLPSKLAAWLPWRARRDGRPWVTVTASKRAGTAVAPGSIDSPARPSAGLEAYRQLRTSLFYAHPGAMLRKLLVTSAVEGEGKTSVAVNLGITLAQQGHHVLLVDCDLYQPQLHRIFQQQLSPGLSEVLFQNLVPTDAVQSTGFSGLFVMPAGMMTGHHVDGVGSARMRAMINDLARNFDVLILDSAPVLAVSDATILSGASDAVLFVVRAGHTKPGDAAEALHHLAGAGAQVAGAVLNDPDNRVPQYGGYAYNGAYARA